MRYGIGTRQDNQRTRLYLTWINCVWKKSIDKEALIVWQSRDFRRDMTWHDMTWYDVTLRDMTWQAVAWRDMTWHDVTWGDMRWHDVAWRDMTWRGITWHDVTWLDNTWHDNTVDNKALVVQPSRDFRATAYKFRAFMSRNECLSKLKNLLNREVTWIFEVYQTW